MLLSNLNSFDHIRVECRLPRALTMHSYVAIYGPVPATAGASKFLHLKIKFSSSFFAWNRSFFEDGSEKKLVFVNCAVLCFFIRYLSDFLRWCFIGYGMWKILVWRSFSLLLYISILFYPTHYKRFERVDWWWWKMMMKIRVFQSFSNVDFLLIGFFFKLCISIVT